MIPLLSWINQSTIVIYKFVVKSQLLVYDQVDVCKGCALFIERKRTTVFPWVRRTTTGSLGLKRNGQDARKILLISIGSGNATRRTGLCTRPLVNGKERWHAKEGAPWNRIGSAHFNRNEIAARISLLIKWEIDCSSPSPSMTMPSFVAWICSDCRTPVIRLLLLCSVFYRCKIIIV